jgi:hypothetical protein
MAVLLEPARGLTPVYGPPAEEFQAVA